MKSTIKTHLKIALAEIGLIEPWWSEEDGMYIFEHEAYPRVSHGDPDPEEARAGYLRALEGFIEDRLNGDLAEEAERVTSGRGGVRPGAGRPAGTKKEPKKRIYLPLALADWLQEPEHLRQVEKLMQG